MNATTLNQKQKENVVKSVHVRVLEPIKYCKLTVGKRYYAEITSPANSRYKGRPSVCVMLNDDVGTPVDLRISHRYTTALRFSTAPGVLETAEETRVRKHFEAFNAALDTVEESTW